MTEAFTAIAQEILQVRTTGEVSLHVQPLASQASDSDIAMIDAFVQSRSFSPLEDAWIAISREQAEMLVLRIIACDLAYGVALTDLDTASHLAAGFIACFADNARWYTNGTWHKADTTISQSVTQGASWTSITPATFDTGVVCLDANNIGILWVQDED
jgi:hypothetical protein